MRVQRACRQSACHTRAEGWFAKYDKMPASLQAALAKTSSVPVDIDPVSAFTEQIR
jgi:hypothetical protein